MKLEELKKLSKEDLISILTDGYVEYTAKDILGVDTTLIYDTKTDTIVDFKTSKDCFYEIQGIDNPRHFTKYQLLFLEALRQSGICNMYMSSKYVEQYMTDEGQISYWMNNYKKIFDTEELI